MWNIEMLYDVLFLFIIIGPVVIGFWLFNREPGTART